MFVWVSFRLNPGTSESSPHTFYGAARLAERGTARNKGYRQKAVGFRIFLSFDVKYTEILRKISLAGLLPAGRIRLSSGYRVPDTGTGLGATIGSSGRIIPFPASRSS